ncbi:MAG: helix-turn-helix domain-containing protein, partial [Pseudomonadota bacterium]
QNQWDSLPPIVYCRGYLRLYAKCVGVNPEHWLRQLDLELEGHAVQSELQKRTDSKKLIGLPSPLNAESPTLPTKRGVSKEWFWQGLALILGLIIVMGAWLWPQTPALELPPTERTLNLEVDEKTSKLMQNMPVKTDKASSLLRAE